MKIGDTANKGTLYGKLLATIALCISLTLLISTLIYSIYYTKIEKNRTFHSDLVNLSMTSREVINLKETSQSLSFQLYRNSTIAYLLYYRQPSIYYETGAMMEMRNYLNSMPFIDSIYVYNSDNRNFYVVSRDGRDGVYLETELYDKDIIERLDEYKTTKPFVPIPRLINGEAGKAEQTPVYTYLAYDAVNPLQTITSAVIINISASWINKEFAGAASGAQSYILDDNSRLLSSTTLAAVHLTEKETTDTIRRISGQEGYYVGQFHGQPSLISYTSPDSLGWQYVRVTPYDQINAKTKSIRNMTLLFAALILIAGLACSRVVSKRLYRPIEKIVDEMKLLENEKRDNLFTLRQNALRNLMLGAHPGISGMRSGTLPRLGISMRFVNGYRVVLLRIDRYQDLLVERSSSIAPYKYAIMNIASEICGQAYGVEGVDMNDDSVVLLLSPLSEEASTDNEPFEALLRECRDACLVYLKIGVSGAYSPLQKDAALLHEVYEKVKEASLYRFYQGYGSMINSALAAGLNREDYVYPTELEKKLVDAIVAGKAAQAEEYWSEIVNQAGRYHYHASRLALSRLAVTLKSVADRISKHHAQSLTGMNEIPDTDEYETVAELRAAYVEWFEELAERLTDKRSSKQSDLIRQINEKINRSYADPNLNLNQIADELDMSPIYISRVYKQHTMMTIMDVVTQQRMQEVCLLLEQTDLSVAAIAERTGFTSNSYLHRTFKRQFNVTPIEYRRSVKKQISEEEQQHPSP